MEKDSSLNLGQDALVLCQLYIRKITEKLQKMNKEITFQKKYQKCIEIP